MTASEELTLAAISRGSREAFATLFDGTSGIVRAELALRVPDARLAAPVFAATYLEVWWLAGCQSGPELDAGKWISRILHRRIADAMAGRSRPLSSELAADQRPSCAELELAALLGRPVGWLWPV